MKRQTSAFSAITLAILTALGGPLAPLPVSATDYGDSPAVAQDVGADIGDLYLFQDASDRTQTVIIATVHGFIVPGQIANVAGFDENIRYRFEIYNNHVNFISPVLDPNQSAKTKANFLKGIKPARFIDVTFTKRSVGPAPQDSIPTNLRRPLPQNIIVTFTGFPGVKTKPIKLDPNGDGFLTTPSDTSGPAADFVINTIQLTPTDTVQLFAGLVDDPAFFDLPALVAYVDGVRSTGTGDPNVFLRKRDTYAGYNTLAIALRIPTALLLQDARLVFLGADFLTQRHGTELRSADGSRGIGTFRTIDRVGSPLANFFIPFDGKNAYNKGTPFTDAKSEFVNPLIETFKELGVVTDPPSTAFNKLAELYITYGDMVQLDTTVGAAPFPGAGRKPTDDAIDYILTQLNGGTTLGDGVDNGGSPLTTFPFLGKPNQPLPTGGPEATRN